MREEDMDRYIRELARRSYNPPPAPPRDELWTRIQAARQAEAASADGGPVVGPADVIDFRSRAAGIRRWSFRILPIAALLLVAFGLGRLSLLYERAHQGSVASAPATSPAGRAPVAVAPEPVPAAGRVAPNAAPAVREPTENAVPAPRLAVASMPRASRPAAPDRTSLYRLAAAQTLGQAELLLTSFRAETRSGGSVDAQVITWAGDVLSSTRLLLDSPAGRDPRLRPLLEDLELVLAQIVQLRAAPTSAAGDDAGLIDRALQQRDIMPRLRTAVPAGANAAI